MLREKIEDWKGDRTPEEAAIDLGIPVETYQKIIDGKRVSNNIFQTVLKVVDKIIDKHSDKKSELDKEKLKEILYVFATCLPNRNALLVQKISEL